jgi:hypothetical protein
MKIPNLKVKGPQEKTEMRRLWETANGGGRFARTTLSKTAQKTNRPPFDMRTYF